MKKNIFVTCLLFLALVTPSFAQRRRRAPKRASNEQSANKTNKQEGGSPKKSAELSLTSFSAKGLNYETELTALYLGDFTPARLQRDSVEFDLLFGTYLNAFASHCS